MGVAELVTQKAFLGKEFLTWLWFRSEVDPVLDLDEGQRCEVETLETIALDAQFGDTKTVALKGEAPGGSPEAASALLEGKKMRRGRFRLNHDAVEWILSLDGETMNISGLKLPKTGRLPFEESIELRVTSMLEFEALLERLFTGFVEMRLDEDAWPQELEKIQAWVAEKNHWEG